MKACNSTRTPEHGVPTPVEKDSVLDEVKAVNGYDDPWTTTDTPYESRSPTPSAVFDDAMRSPGDELGEIDGKIDGTKKNWKEGRYNPSSWPKSPSSTPTPSSGNGDASATPDASPVRSV